MSDSRFARLHSDPRFRRPKKQKSNVALDDRFKSVFSSSSSSSQVDKYGRKQSKRKQKEDLSKLNHFEARDKGPSEEAPRIDYARGQILMESSDEEDEGDSSETDSEVVAIGGDQNAVEIDLDENDIAELDEQAAEYQRNHPVEAPSDIKETSRIAAVNLDWDHVRASHLFKICSSIISLPPPTARPNAPTTHNGRVLSVRIYPSQFGKERMAREEREGPPKEIFRDNDRDEEQINENTIYQLGNAEEAHGNEALRKYQLERLRYYYAIITCDSVKSAALIYNELEGTELERSANVFDLSYVPEDMTFDEEFRDEATCENDTNFKAVDFVTDALRHSKVKLVWDEDDTERTLITRRKLSQKEIADSDFQNYLASSSDSESEAQDQKSTQKAASKERLRALLLGKSEDLPEGWGGDEDDGDVDMEVTFTAGLGQTRDEETTLEQYQRKLREKRKAKKANRQDAKPTEKDEFFDEEEDDGQETVTGGERPVASAEELALLTSRDGVEPKHFDMKAVLKAEKSSKRKRKGKKAEEAHDLQEEFRMNTSDPRFAAVHDDPNFAIDPSNPHFKKTKGMSAFLDERHTRFQRDITEEGDESLTSLVERVKRKSGHSSKTTGKRRKIG